MKHLCGTCWDRDSLTWAVYGVVPSGTCESCGWSTRLFVTDAMTRAQLQENAMAESWDAQRGIRPNAEALREQGDLRDMQQASCGSCGYDWLAPVVGRCPRCRSEQVAVNGERFHGAPRV